MGTVLMDNEFEKLRNLVSILAINTTAAKEHVPEVERKIRLIKERRRGILNTLPFKKMPRLMLIELVYHVVLWLTHSRRTQECPRHFPHGKLFTGTSWILQSTASHHSGRTVRSMMTQRQQHHGDSLNPGNCARSHWKPARDLQVSQPRDRKESQATRIHSIPHARLGHQEG